MHDDEVASIRAVADHARALWGALEALKDSTLEALDSTFDTEITINAKVSRETMRAFESEGKLGYFEPCEGDGWELPLDLGVLTLYAAPDDGEIIDPEAVEIFRSSVETEDGRVLTDRLEIRDGVFGWWVKQGWLTRDEDGTYRASRPKGEIIKCDVECQMARMRMANEAVAYVDWFELPHVEGCPMFGDADTGIWTVREMEAS